MSSGELLSYTNLKKLLLDQCQTDLNLTAHMPEEPPKRDAPQKVVVNRIDAEFVSNNFYKLKYIVLPGGK